jgi:hypothetical protein
LARISGDNSAATARATGEEARRIGHDNNAHDTTGDGTGKRRCGSEILIGQGLATPAEIDAALQRQRQEGGRLGATLVAMGVMTVGQLLTALRNQHQAGSSVELCERTLERWETLYGPLHPNTSRAHYNLARALMTSGRTAEAARHAEAAFAGHTRMLGARHICTQEAARLITEANRALARAAGARPAAAG